MFGTKTHKSKIHRRLFNIRSEKVGVVDHGANGREWLIKKRDGDPMKINLENLGKIHSLLGQVISVAKAGALDQPAKEALSGKLTEVGSLLKGAGFPMLTSADVAKDLSDMGEQLRGIAQATGDLNVADNLDTIIHKVEDISNQLATAKEPDAEDAAKATAAAVSTPAAAPIATPQLAEAAAAATQQATPAQAAPAAQAAVQAPAPVSSAIAAPVAPVAAATVETPVQSADVVTTKQLGDTLNEFKTSLLGDIKTLLAAEVTTAKNATLAGQLTVAPAVIEDLTAPKEHTLDSPYYEGEWPDDFNAR